MNTHHVFDILQSSLLRSILEKSQRFICFVVVGALLIAAIYSEKLDELLYFDGINHS